MKGYKGAHPDFPHESTADQFFEPEQFEAYREAGYRTAMCMTGDLPTLERALLGDEAAIASLHAANKPQRRPSGTRRQKKT